MEFIKKAMVLIGKTALGAVIFLVLIIVIAGFLPGDEPPEPIAEQKKPLVDLSKIVDPEEEAAKKAAAEQRQKNLDAALAAVKAEPKVKDAAWNNTYAPSLLAGVFDDGTSRDGYAQYLCMVLIEHQLRGGVVRVMDVVKSLKDEWKELGKAQCPE